MAKRIRCTILRSVPLRPRRCRPGAEPARPANASAIIKPIPPTDTALYEYRYTAIAEPASQYEKHYEKPLGLFVDVLA